MKLDQAEFERYGKHTIRYNKYLNLYKEFVTSAHWLEDYNEKRRTDFRFTNVSERAFDVSSMGCTLRFKFMTSYKDSTLQAYIACYKLEEGIKQQYQDRLIFDGNGIVDIEQEENEDKCYLQQHAPEIVTQFFIQAMDDSLISGNKVSSIGIAD